MKKNIRQTAAAFLAVLLIIGTFPVSIFAAEGNTPKEEVVYVNLNTDGSVKEINVVNIFDLDESGRIIDYGKYETLRNMTSTDPVDYQNDTVTIDADAGKLYYEGKLKDDGMPWTISVTYYMDGTEYSAEKIAGKSGKLEIKMSIRQNTKCDSSFFEGYALQATFVLDTENAANITANGATVANVGSEKQITYTILPNTEKDISISADVKNFEMDGIAINGVRLSLNIDIDDAALHEKMDEVLGGVSDLDDGAGKLKDGAKELYDATGILKNKTGEFHTGVGSLASGASDLKNGLAALTAKNSELIGAAWSAYEALCSAAETQLNAQLTTNGLKTVTLTPSTYSDALLEVLKQMDADIVYHKAYDAALSEITEQVEAQADTLYAGYIASQADAVYFAYIRSQADVLYTQVASEAVIQQLIENGYTKEQASAYLKTSEGKILVATAVSAMTEEQKEQIITSAVQNLTEEQKNQILQGAITALTEDEKTEIRNASIQQLMASDDVTTQINEAVKAVNTAAEEVSALKGQLDQYGAFYDGLVDYTNGVSAAAGGASNLATGLSTLYRNTDAFTSAVGDLHLAVGTLKDGTNQLKDGTEEFVSETDGMDTKVSNEIDKILSEITGDDVETISFVSEQNTNVKSVQFVIQTERISMAEADETAVTQTEQLHFWQKLLRLFGLDW